MKRKTKLLILTLTLSLFISVFAIGASCEAGEFDTGADIAANGEGAGTGDISGEPNDTAAGGENAGGSGEGVLSDGEGNVTASQGEAANTNEDTGGAGNFFESIYALALENADKLFSLLAFIGTLIVGFAYKRGLIPLLSGNLTSLAETVSKIREDIDTKGESDSDFLAKLAELMRGFEEGALILKDGLHKVEGELEELKQSGSKVAMLERLYASELEVLYEVLMASSLPQYRKDRIGESFSRIKDSLAEIKNETTGTDT